VSTFAFANNNEGTILSRSTGLMTDAMYVPKPFHYSFVYFNLFTSLNMYNMFLNIVYSESYVYRFISTLQTARLAAATVASVFRVTLTKKLTLNSE